MKRNFKILPAIIAAALSLTAVCVPVSAADITAFSKTEAEEYSGQDGISIGDENSGGCVGWINNGDYTFYKNVDFGTGANTFSVNASSISEKGTACGRIELRLDSKDGTLIGSCKITGTGSWSEWQNFSCNIKGASGVHDLYLVYKDSESNSGYLFNVNYFSFSSNTKGTGYWEITLKKGKSAQFGIDTDAKVKYTSSDKSVASVNSSGEVTAKKEGTAVITASYGGKTQKIKIKVV